MKPKHPFISDSTNSAFYFQFEIILFQAQIIAFLFAVICHGVFGMAAAAHGTPTKRSPNVSKPQTHLQR